jgi:hypothetical protein
MSQYDGNNWIYKDEKTYFLKPYENPIIDTFSIINYVCEITTTTTTLVGKVTAITPDTITLNNDTIIMTKFISHIKLIHSPESI